jgi:beta-glucosidase
VSDPISFRDSFELPSHFLLGTATAGAQVEGGDTNNSWYRWAERGGTVDGSTPIVANDHWNRLEEDTALLRELGCQTHRMSVEWSRIEPAPGEWSHSALDHYRQELGLLRDAGIEPLVTLHHFANPLWLEDAGGWLNREVVRLFARYVREVVRVLGDLVTDWVPINEPNVYLAQGHLLGLWPPGKQSLRDFLRGSRHMIAAHREAYRTIHAEPTHGRSARVGVAHHVRVFEPGSRAGSSSVAALYDRLFHRRFLDPLRGYLDFIGVNYYTRDVVDFSPHPARLFGRLAVAEGTATNDLGWEIYPPGLHSTVRELYRSYGLPLFITENGIADRRDMKRSAFIYDHLREVRRLLDAGVPIERYYHWTLLDNFEWAEGYTAAFGLYECDPRTQQRVLRPSGRFFSQICATRTVHWRNHL